MPWGSLHFFKTVGFLADALDPLDANVTPLEQSDGLLTARRPACIGAFWHLGYCVRAGAGCCVGAPKFTLGTSRAPSAVLK